MRAILLAVFCFCTIVSSSQDPAGSFSKIRFAGYELQGDQKKLFFYSEIDPAGNFTINFGFLVKPVTVKLKLADSTLQVLRSVFNGKDPKKYIEPKEMNRGEHFSASSYRYLQVESGGKIQEISFVRYMLDEKLRQLIATLEEILDQEDLPKVNTSLRPSSLFLKALDQSFRKSNLPK